MQYLGGVSSEGGPLLIADATLALHWHGNISNGQDDYERACEILLSTPELEGAPIPIDDGVGLIWEMGGGGTSDVFLKKSGHVVIIRSWLDDPDSDEVIADLAKLPLQKFLQLGSLEVTSGIVAILWAPESGKTVETEMVNGESADIAGLSVDGSGLMIKLERGKYQCLHDEVDGEQGEARRLHLVSQNQAMKSHYFTE